MENAVGSVDAETRRAALAQRLQKAQGDGWRVESQTEFSASLAKGHRPNHLLHLVLTVLTLELWAIVWIILAITNKEKHRFLAVDEQGNVTG